MFRLQGIATAEQVVKKSRFRAIAVPVDSEADAKAALALHADAGANHNCWAWRIGTAYRFSDDGEPAGTAGKPILAAIDGADVDHVLVIVTRWFGGILLGAGGLVRAYGGTAAVCLKGAEIEPIVALVTGSAHVAFADLALVRARLEATPGLVVTDVQFDESGALLAIRVPTEIFEIAARTVADLTRGKAMLKLEAAG